MNPSCSAGSLGTESFVVLVGKARWVPGLSSEIFSGGR